MSWERVIIDDVLKYEQPTNYIVESEDYDDSFEIPVLTAGKSFLLGYTDEKENVFNEIPVIIFDDFTTSIQFVDFPFKVKSSAMKILKPVKEKADVKYLFYKMQTIKFEAGEHKRYWISKYSQLEIPLPPLPTQQKIAEKLDKADALRKKDQQLLKHYDELAQSVFIEMFGDPVRNEKGWEIKFIEDFVSKKKNSIKRGPFGGALKKEIFVEEGYLVYEQYHALNNDYSFGRYFIDEEKFKELIGFEVNPGDILISCSGVYLGKLSVVPEDAKKGIINQALLKLTLDKSKMENEFFTFHFTQEDFKKKYFDSDRGAGIPNFPPMAEFKKFPFIYPPIKLQQKFATIIQNIEQQKQKVKLQTEESENLFQALLQESFA